MESKDVEETTETIDIIKFKIPVHFIKVCLQIWEKWPLNYKIMQKMVSCLSRQVLS